MPKHYEARITREAWRDLDAIAEYIRQDSPQNAAETIDRFLTSIEGLESFPHRYPVFRRGTRTRAAVRIMPVASYLVYYRILEQQQVIRILTVRHGHRRRPRTLP